MPESLAYETDQYSHRLRPIEDSLAPLDAKVNAELVGVVRRWRGEPDRLAVAEAVYRRLGGLFWVDKLERFINRNEEIDKLPQRDRQSIYSELPLRATRVNYVFGVSRTLKVNGSLVGTDKIGHFFSLGLKYFRRWTQGRELADILARGARVERWWFGGITTGAFSNGDLVSNYEGFLFYRSLLEDDVIPGKKAILGVRDGKLLVQRPFTWADHINDYWDEALNPNWFIPVLARRMPEVLEPLCADVRERPDAYRPADEAALVERYRHLHLRPAPEHRLDIFCDALPDGLAGAGGEGLD